MRWFKIERCTRVKIGEDSLFNPIFDEQFQVIPEKMARFSTWTKEELLLENREVYRVSRKVLTNAKSVDLTEIVRIGGKRYKVEMLEGSDDERWRILAVKSYEKG